MAGPFVPARGLQLRMLVALAVNAALLVAVLAFAVWVVMHGGWSDVFFAGTLIIVVGDLERALQR